MPIPKGSDPQVPATSPRVGAGRRSGPGVPGADACALLPAASGKVRSDAGSVFRDQPAHTSGPGRHEGKRHEGKREDGGRAAGTLLAGLHATVTLQPRHGAPVGSSPGECTVPSTVCALALITRPGGGLVVQREARYPARREPSAHRRPGLRPGHGRPGLRPGRGVDHGPQANTPRAGRQPSSGSASGRA